MVRTLLIAVMVVVAWPLYGSPADAQVTLIASYPLNGTAEDATGNNDPMSLFNAPYEDGGIYLNGIYADGTPGASEAQTPTIAALDFSAFTISLDFKIGEHPEFNRPVFIGSSWRWAGAILDPDGKLHLYYNDTLGQPGSQVVSLDTWHTLFFTYDGTVGHLYLDYQLVTSQTFDLDSNDYRFIVFHNGGNGTAFKGHLRNLNVYNGVLDPTPVAGRTWGAIKAQYR